MDVDSAPLETIAIRLQRVLPQYASTGIAADISAWLAGLVEVQAGAATVSERHRVTRFRCAVCGALTAGRVPRGGDGTLRYPRRHSRDGEPCPGNNIEAERVDVEAPRGSP